MSSAWLAPDQVPGTAAARPNRSRITILAALLHKLIAPGLPPHAVRLCVHCRANPAGFWVSGKSARTVRRPWCLSCCDVLDRGRHDVTGFGS